jgi:hypothetical protein
MRTKFVNEERGTPMQRICGEHGVSTEHDAGSAAPLGEQGEKASRIGSSLRDRETLEGQTQAPIKDSVGRAIYHRRNAVCEGGFANIKHAIGFNRFRMKGLEGTGIERLLRTIIYNCRKITSMT